MPNKHKTRLIGWHSADPTLKQWVKAEAGRRGITEREFLDEALAEKRQRLSGSDPATPETRERQS